MIAAHKSAFQACTPNVGHHHQHQCIKKHPPSATPLYRCNHLLVTAVFAFSWQLPGYTHSKTTNTINFLIIFHTFCTARTRINEAISLCCWLLSFTAAARLHTFQKYQTINFLIIFHTFCIAHAPVSMQPFPCAAGSALSQQLLGCARWHLHA